jgi:hypothetical protein
LRSNIGCKKAVIFVSDIRFQVGDKRAPKNSVETSLNAVIRCTQVAYKGKKKFPNGLKSFEKFQIGIGNKKFQIGIGNKKFQIGTKLI